MDNYTYYQNTIGNYNGILEDTDYDVKTRIKNALDKTFDSPIDAKEYLAKLMMMLNAEGYRGKYKLTTNGNRIVQVK